MTDKEYSKLGIKVALGKATDQEFIDVMMHEGMNESEAKKLIAGYHNEIGEMAKAERGLL